MNEMTSITGLSSDGLALQRIRALLPEIEARADEIERDAKGPLTPPWHGT
jgi:hypothetical protein